MVPLVERKVTWGEATRRAQRIIAEGQAQVAAANQRWMAAENAENQAELNRRAAAAAEVMQWYQQQQMINAINRPAPVYTPPIHCSSFGTSNFVQTNCN
jgi:hypothetical protein